MTNKQLAAARRAMNQFPALRALKDGNTIRPVKPGSPPVLGAPVTVTETMSEAQVESDIKASCEAIV